MTDEFAMFSRGRFADGFDPNKIVHEMAVGGSNIQPAGWYSEHEWNSSVGQANVLLDPTFETPRDAGGTLGTGATTNGKWAGHYALTSGTVPTGRTLQRYLMRGNPNGNPFNSGVLLLELSGFGANAFTGDFYVYPETDFAPSSSTLDWLVAAMRIYVPAAVTNTVTTLTAVLEIYDVTNSAVVATSSDTVDLLTMATFSPFPLVVAVQETAAVFTARSWRMRLKIHCVKPATSTATADICLAEPQLHFNYTPRPLPFAPLVANWFSPTHAAPGLDLVAATSIFPYWGSVIHPISASGGDVTLTSTPTVSDSVDGHEIVLLNVDTTHTVTIQDQGTLGSSNLRLTANTVAIGPRDSVRLVYSATVGDWVQIGNLVSVL